MLGKEYVAQILEPYVKQWLERGDDFILEEDRDSRYSRKQSARNSTWK